MKLEIGQTWISNSHPHEDFEIYDGIVDTCADSFQDEILSFDQQPEGTKIFFWQRVNMKAFNDFVSTKKGRDFETTFPYANSGECKKASIVSKIRKFNMELK